MSPSDFQVPDDFPDMTLPERARPDPEPLPRSASPSRPDWRAGDRVLAPWEPDFVYAGRITKIKQEEALVEFEDGDAGWVSLHEVRPVAVRRGQKVMCRKRMGPVFFPGEILDVCGDEVRVVFAEDGENEWTRLAALRIPCEVRGPGATPLRVASQMAFLENLRPGLRVWAPWDSGTLFAGTVDQIEGSAAHIHFDDGNQGWVRLEQVAPLEIPVGLHVLGRWKMGAGFYPGRVTKKEGERLFIQYDDGDREWTTTAALAVPCEPFGPDARPTKVVPRGNRRWGWLFAVLVGVVYVLLRSGCRAGW